MNAPVKINQGRPYPSKYFTVVLPMPMAANIEVGTQVECQDPKQPTAIMAEVVDFWTFNWLQVPDALVQLAYGVDAQTLKTALERSKPEFMNCEYIRLALVCEK